MTACGRCHTPLEASDLRCSICALAVPRAADGAGPTPRARILRCRECAAAVSYSAAAQAPHCGFCGAIMEVEVPEDPVEAAERLVPFAVDRDGAVRALRSWLGSRGWFRPRDLSGAAIDSMRPLYWSAWIFDADATVSWAADSDAGSGRSAWAPHAGSAAFQWRTILIPASRGLRDEETARLAAGHALEGAVPVEAVAPLEGGAIEAFDVQRSAARRRIADAIEMMAVRELQSHGHIPGHRFRNVHASVLLSRLVTGRYVLPAWVTAYRYRGSIYRTIVHGQDPSIVIGEAPLSWTRITVLIAVVLAVLALVLVVLGTR
jgi:hypothetical protein